MFVTGFEDVEHLLQCLVNADVDDDCACLTSGGGPAMNTDISGPGVRISFYLQAYFLSLLSARSGSLEEITAALYTLIATNVAMTVASFMLGFRAEPTMSLHDAIVVFYLLALSWASVFTSMPAYNRFIRSDRTLKVVSIVQSYLIFALGLAVLIRAPTLGSTPRCNSHAVAVVFRQFPALNAGRIAAFIVLSVVILFYTVLSFSDYRRSVIRRYRSFKSWADHGLSWKIKQIKDSIAKWVSRGLNVRNRNRNVDATSSEFSDDLHITSTVKGKEREGMQTDAPTQGRREGKDRKSRKGDVRNKDIPSGVHATKTKGHDFGVFGTLLVELIVITILWALFVMNTELLILRNRFDGGSDGLSSSGLWQFGQILPMFLVVLPLVNLIKVFRKLGFTRRPHRKRVHRRRMHPGGHEHKHSQPNTAAGDSGASYFRSTSDGTRRQPFFGGEFIPYFFPRPQAPAASGLGDRSSAHISLHSIHSSISMHGNSSEGTRSDQAGQGHPSPSSSASRLPIPHR